MTITAQESVEKTDKSEPILQKVSPRLLILDRARVRLAELDRQEWVANVEERTTIEDILQPGFWSMSCDQFKPYDHIEVRIDDGSWIAKFLVLECEKNWAKTILLERHDLTKGVTHDYQSVTHKVEFKGPHYRFSVIRLKDGEKIKTGCATRYEAQDWLRSYETNAT